MFDEVSCRYLLPGEIFQSSEPIMVNTVLGSCVSVTMYCRKTGFGIISHSMLPSSKDSADKEPNCMKYVDCSILHMHKVFTDLNIDRKNIEVKLFGGSDMFDYNKNTETIGSKNINAAVENLAKLKYTITARDIGGQFTRKLYFSTETGIVYVRKISKLQGI
jgi:chemotaxis protein CheD